MIGQVWIAFLVGVIIGVFVALFVFALCFAAKTSDEEDKMYRTVSSHRGIAGESQEKNYAKTTTKIHLS